MRAKNIGSSEGLTHRQFVVKAVRSGCAKQGVDIGLRRRTAATASALRAHRRLLRYKRSGQ